VPETMTRRCGSSDFTLSELGVGGWSFGGGEYWGEQEQADIDAVTKKALEQGVYYFDTAEAYDNGKSEEALGKALKTLPEDLRAKAVIGTKVLPNHCAPKVLREHLEKSLKRLQLESVDLYMVHWPIPAPTEEGEDVPNVTSAFKTLVELQKEGLIKHIGVSNFGVKQLTEALQTGATIVVNQLPYGLFLRTIEIEVLPLCKEHGIGVIGYSPLLQGILTGKYNSIDEIPDYRLRTRHFAGTRPRSRHGGPGCEEALWASLEKIKEIAKREGVTPATLALSWCLKNPLITCIIPGSRNLEQLETNIQATNYVMSDELWQELNDVTEEVKKHLGTALDIYESAENGRSF